MPLPNWDCRHHGQRVGDGGSRHRPQPAVPRPVLRLRRRGGHGVAQFDHRTRVLRGHRSLQTAHVFGDLAGEPVTPVVISKLIGAAGAECVSAPMLISCAPARAYPATVSTPMPPEAWMVTPGPARRTHAATVSGV